MRSYEIEIIAGIVHKIRFSVIAFAVFSLVNYSRALTYPMYWWEGETVGKVLSCPLLGPGFNASITFTSSRAKESMREKKNILFH